ncbi:hypothetical protein SLS55_005930 [Diplodia seriata]|uniref:Uncharacterized protein n=1 Tax=Diplodia seriata TaxID=420778 RepID=A0ABR3CL65_9PEZI
MAVHSPAPVRVVVQQLLVVLPAQLAATARDHGLEHGIEAQVVGLEDDEVQVLPWAQSVQDISWCSAAPLTGVERKSGKWFLIEAAPKTTAEAAP